jgi:N6-adenosine-specific RNA methylase IME4
MYKTIALDPPWLERGGGKYKRGADRHYPLMSTAEIVATVMSSEPYGRLAGASHCWCWVTDNYLEDGLRLMKAMGFRYVRTLAWVKVKRTVALPRDPGSPHTEITNAFAGELLSIGLGQYLRGAHELALLGVRGDAMVPATADRMPSVVFAPKAKHSEKPQAAFDVFERCSPGPRVEMFARKARPGWDAWGNEAP